MKIRTPAKLILSGEHAVVYGNPALAVAINLYTNVTIRKTASLCFSFNFKNLNFRKLVALQELRKLQKKLEIRYQQYCLGYLDIQEVLKNPSELSLFTFIKVLNCVKNNLPMSIDTIIDSDIPIGYGIGSSAASVVGLVHALTQFLNINLNSEDYFKLSIESENLQHGYSSGLDIYTVYYGGCIRYAKGKFEKRFIPNFSMQLVQTGRPKSNTGECVLQASSLFKKSRIGDDFSAITNELDQALQNCNFENIKNCIQQNHRLLKTIGVVPNKIDCFIIDVEKIGGSAKICGAGSIQGDNGGSVLVITDNPINNLIQQYDYSVVPIRIDSQGVQCIV
ncbi:mevalonate kinase [Coxiella endosymbiont of Amblyomma sculptum]|uniref:mevalonate kinase n=1 Tax=Coxiella endosymbiont of Amblyomma sculptum TaxID=2487929 RepID=UPI001FE3451D|nr:mevalonate kinase [Coxiella endosymbiont of Amblyomma sculptum]